MGQLSCSYPVFQVGYWHVELDSHDIILAERLPTESYLDIGNRTAFVNGGTFLDLHPDFRPKHWAETYVPLVLDGPEIGRARATLLARAEALGYGIRAEADLHVIADGKRIEPVWPGKARAALILAPGAKASRRGHAASFRLASFRRATIRGSLA